MACYLTIFLVKWVHFIVVIKVCLIYAKVSQYMKKRRAYALISGGLD